MANKYCNLDGSKKIKDEYTKINVGFDLVETDVNNLDTKIDNVNSRVNTIIITPADSVSAQEIIDARKGEEVLGDKIDKIDNSINEVKDDLATRKADNMSFYINVKYPPSPLSPAHSIEEPGYENFVSTEAIQAIIDYAYDHGIRRIYLPKGTYLANITLHSGMILEGAGRINTEIRSYDPSKPTVSTNQNLYITIKDIDITAPYEQIEPLLDVRSSRYFVGKNIRVSQLPNEHNEYSYSAKAIDMSIVAPATWVGYNRLKNVTASNCSYGLFTGGGLNSVLSMEDCNMSSNGYYNIYLDGVEVAHINNLDCAGGGKLAGEDEVDVELYGGIYIKGTNINITSVWYEQNHKYIANSLMTNDCYIHPDSRNININSERIYWTNQDNFYLLEEELKGRNTRVIVPLDMGIGKGRPMNILPNSCFKYLDSTNVPIGWIKVNTPIITPITSDLPTGIETGLRLTGTGGITGLYFNIYDSLSGNGLIKNLTNYIGQEIVMTYYYKSNSEEAGRGRAGIKLVAGNYFTAGDVFHPMINTGGKWVKVIQRHKITGDEIYIRPQFQISPLDETFDITQVLFAFDDHVIDTGDTLLNLQGSITWNPGSLADGEGKTSAGITVKGAEFGDFVLVAAPYDLQGITCNGYVSSVDTVKIRIQNETGGTIDLAEGIWKVKVIKSY